MDSTETTLMFWPVGSLYGLPSSHTVSCRGGVGGGGWEVDCLDNNGRARTPQPEPTWTKRRKTPAKQPEKRGVPCAS